MKRGGERLKKEAYKSIKRSSLDAQVQRAPSRRKAGDSPGHAESGRGVVYEYDNDDRHVSGVAW